MLLGATHEVVQPRGASVGLAVRRTLAWTLATWEPQVVDDGELDGLIEADRRTKGPLVYVTDNPWVHGGHQAKLRHRATRHPRAMAARMTTPVLMIPNKPR